MTTGTIRGIQEYAAHFNETQAARDKVVQQGRRAYRLMIELRDNPLNSPTDRKLWEEGWTKEARDFATKNQRKEAPMRRN